MPQLNGCSLEEYLRRSNPKIDSIEVKGPENDSKPSKKSKTSGASSKNRNWDSPGEVRSWESFSLDAFESIYKQPLKEILDHRENFNDFSTIPEFPFCEIRDEDTLEALLIKYVHSTVSEALAVAQSNLKHQDSSKNIYMARGGFASVSKSSRSKNPKNKPTWFYPDWAGVQHSDPPVKGRNLLPEGDTKLARKWPACQLEEKEGLVASHNAAWLWPLRQIFTYCLRSGARYGYLITDEELVVVRIRLSGSFLRSDELPARPANQGLLEWKAIPWKHDTGSSQLTVNLALWWLHMMAARNGNFNEEDRANISQHSNGQDTQDSATTFDGFDSQERLTPDLADDSQVHDTSFLSNTSEARQGLSRTTISDDHGDGSPTTQRSSKKRGRESDSKESIRKTKRGGKRSN